MADMRVYELAKELGVDSRSLMAELRDMGEFVRSASSILPQPMITRIRERATRLTQGQRRAPQRNSSLRPPREEPVRRNPFAAADLRTAWPSGADGMVIPRRQSYRGPRPDGLLKVLLNGYIVRTAHVSRPPRSRYWEDEVERARRLVSEWKAGLLYFPSNDVLLAWVNTRVGAEAAIELYRRGVMPAEVGWSYDDRGRDPLDARLQSGEFTIDQVVNEVEGRRMRADL